MKANSSAGGWIFWVLAGAISLCAQIPDTGDPPQAPNLARSPRSSAIVSNSSLNWYDVSNRAAVRDGWNRVFLPTLSVPMEWNGDVAAGNPGTTSQAYKDAVAQRINWFRAMAGVPAGITIDPVNSAKAQQAAMMFSVNRQINHYPPDTWINYTAEGAEAARNSNICYGYTNDPGCIVAYVVDWGSNNTAAGHRRWVLYPQTQVMGTGDVPQSGPASNPYPPANALWVFDSNTWKARPATRDGYVAWPPPGFTPYQVVGPRWSLSYPGADFSNATVSMQRNGGAVPVRLETVQTGYGENTLVWIPDNLSVNWQPVAPASDTTSTVTVSNVLIGGTPQSFSYAVTVFDPATVSGGTFAFTPASASVSHPGGTGATSLTVTPSGTTWGATSSAAWLGVSPSSGTGSASITWSATANTSSYSRSATITAGTGVFTVTQSGVPCVYTLGQSSATLPATGGIGSVVVSAAPSDCNPGYSWTGALTVSSTWIPGSITLTYTAGANTGTSTRTFTITAGGQVTFTISQPGINSPALSVSKSHAGNFRLGQTAATYTVTLTNTAAIATSGSVSVTDLIPSGLTLVSMTGAGWGCTGNTCTRSDALGGGSAYPAITVTVNVAPNAPAQVTNQVTVSGGGSPSASAGDVTTIVPASNSDFNLDGHPDVIWQDPVSGWAQIWFLTGSSGTTLAGAANLTVSNTWRIVGVGDLNADGRPDVVWQDPATGAAQVWYLGGASGNIVTGAAVLSTGNSWRIMALADFNRDGRPDLIWQDPVSGWAQIWFLSGAQGTTVTGAVNLTASNLWRIAGAGDFDGDGRPDVLWQDQATGNTQIWYLGGTQGNVITSAVNLPPAGGAWRIAAITDFNGDGHPELVWQNSLTGESAAWFLGGPQGISILSSSSVSGPNSWRIAGPK